MTTDLEPGYCALFFFFFFFFVKSILRFQNSVILFHPVERERNGVEVGTGGGGGQFYLVNLVPRAFFQSPGSEVVMWFDSPL